MKLLEGLSAGIAALAIIATAQTASAETDISFALDWKFEGPAAPFTVALDKGYYAEEGLNVSIDSGSGSSQTIPRIATGNYDIGTGDLSALVKFKDQNPDAAVQGVMVLYDAPAFAIISLEGRGIDPADPKSLEGKTLGAPPPDSAFAQWPSFVAINGIDENAVKIESVGFPVREPMLAAGDVDGIFGFSFSSYLNLKSKGVAPEDIKVMMMSDHGLELYGNFVIVNTDFAKENPDAVKAFLRASIRGLKDVMADPEGAIDSVLARNDVGRREVEVERLQMAIRDNIATGWVMENGFGDVVPERLDASLEQIGTSYEYTNKPAAADIFTPEYLPDADARNLN
ncbi:MAG: ABC transporter substrate-binding protein [Geminicoccaceae bacterium]